MQFQRIMLCAIIGWLMTTSVGLAVDWGLKEGTPAIKSISALAFGPDGILFVGDHESAAIFAIDTGDTQGDAAKAWPDVEEPLGKIYQLMGGGAPGQHDVSQLAVNKLTGNVFLATRSRSIVRVDGTGNLTKLSLQKVPFHQFTLPDIPKGTLNNRWGKCITDLAYFDGRVFVAGLFSIKAYPFPFPKADGADGVRVDVNPYTFETDTIIQCFVPMTIGEHKFLLAGFDCTLVDDADFMPLVRFPIGRLKPGTIVRGTTIAKLSFPLTSNQIANFSEWRSRAKDMISYQQDGNTYLLMSNSEGCVFKIKADDLAESETQVSVPSVGNPSRSFETVKVLMGKVKMDRLNVKQMDRLNETHAVIWQGWGLGGSQLCTVRLP